MILEPEEKKRRRLLRLAGARVGKVFIGPEVVHVHVTTRCNLSCLFCWQHSPDSPLRKMKAVDFPFKRLQGVFEDCTQLSVDAIVLGGNGEPSMHPDFLAIMAMLEQKPFSTTLYTNAAFAEKGCQAAVKADHVIVNLGAADRTAYRALHGKDLFARVIANIQRMTEFRDKFKPALRIEVGVVLNRTNVRQQENIRRLVRRLGCDDLQIIRMRQNSIGLETVAPPPTEGSLAGAAGGVHPCWNGWFYLLVSVDGAVSVCSRLYDQRMGDINKSSLRSVWNSQALMSLRIAGQRGEFRGAFRECASCRRWDRGDVSGSVMAL